MRNRYIFRARISEARFRRILRLFALDLNAMQIAALSGCSRVTINRYLRVLRERMAAHCDACSPMVSGEVEVDESYFGARRATGTPPGVGLGMNPPQFLKVGDVMELEVEGLGRQRQEVIGDEE